MNMTSQYYHTCMLTKYIYIYIYHIYRIIKTPPDLCHLNSDIQAYCWFAPAISSAANVASTLHCCTFYLVIFNLSLTLNQFSFCFLFMSASLTKTSLEDLLPTLASSFFFRQPLHQHIITRWIKPPLFFRIFILLFRIFDAS